jgi:hypothetical protein
MNATKEIRRHGDILIKRMDGLKIPKGTKLKATKLLYAGQNHDHYFSKGVVEIGSNKDDGRNYLRVKKAAVISHGRGDSVEHGDGDLPVGDYYWEIQSEFDHASEESRQVID